MENKTISKENQIILPSFSVGWTPNENETEKSLLAIVEFLKDSEITSNDEQEKGRRYVLDHFSKYRVQFKGKIKNGQKYITCNFFPKTDNFPEWKTNFVTVDGGGWNYFQCNYNVVMNRVEGCGGGGNR